MNLPLTFRDLEIGKLYTGWWSTLRSNQRIEDVWLQREPVSSGGLGGAVASLSCFMLLEKQEDPDREEEAMCKIITNNGEVGWAVLVDGIHWFTEIIKNKEP